MNKGDTQKKTTKKGSGNFACKYLRYTSLDTLSTKTSKDPGHDGVYSPSNNQPASQLTYVSVHHCICDVCKDF